MVWEQYGSKVDDKQLLEKLSVAKPKGAEFIKNVPAAIVVCSEWLGSDIRQRRLPPTVWMSLLSTRSAITAMAEKFNPLP
jgi:hypothetical protein